MFFKKTGTHDMKRWLHFLWFIFTTTLLADRYEAVVDAGAAEVAHEIGTAHVQGDLGPVTHKAAHAALGAASSALTGQDPAAGAIGAAVAETVAEVAHVPGKNPITTSKQARFVSSALAFLAGRDPVSANDAAQNAV